MKGNSFNRKSSRAERGGGGSDHNIYSPIMPIVKLVLNMIHLFLLNMIEIIYIFMKPYTFHSDFKLHAKINQF